MTSSNGKHFPRYWPFVRGIHRSPVNSPHKGQWRGALMFSLICTRINGWVNNGEAGDLRRHLAHYVVTVMITVVSPPKAGQVSNVTCFGSIKSCRMKTVQVQKWKKMNTMMKMIWGWVNTLSSKQNRHHFTDDIIESNSRGWKLLYVYSNFTEVYSYRWKHFSIR